MSIIPIIANESIEISFHLIHFCTRKLTNKRIFLYSRSLLTFLSMIDLHFHTTLSDGTSTSEELVQEAIRRWTSLIACTDHDIVNREVPTLIREFNSNNTKHSQESPYIDVVEWVEVSVGHRDGNYEKSLHITMYTREFSQGVDDILSGIRKGKWEKIVRQCAHLGKMGFQIKTDDILSNIPFSLVGVMSRFPNSRSDNLNNGHLNELLTELPSNIELMKELTHGAVDEKNLLGEWLKREGKYTRIISLPEDVPPYEPTLAAVTNKVDTDDTVVSIAHPNKTWKTIQEFRARVGGLVAQWVNAVEINTDATEEWVQAIQEVREKYDLLLTFGSDTHKLKRAWKYGKVLGNMNPYVSRETAERWRAEFLLRTYGIDYRRREYGVFS